MHDYLLSTEWVRFAFVSGIAVSMLLYERRHLTTGSIVVPGYIAVFMLHPLVVAATFLNAFVTYGLVNGVLRRYVLLYGRTKFTALAIVSTTVQAIMVHFSPAGPWLWEQEISFFVGAGYIVPALIAHDMARQGIWKTTTSVLLAGALVAVPIVVALLLDLPGANDLAPVLGAGRMAFPIQWLPVAIVVSIVASWAVAHNYGSRSGGFIGAAFVGMFLADIWQVAAALVIAGASYLIVTKLLMPRMILFGRRKFSAMLLVSSTIAWPALWLGGRVLTDGQLVHVSVGSLALTPLLLPGLIANDAHRTAPSRVVVGLAVASLSALTTTWWVGSTVTGQYLAPGWKLVSAATLLLLLWPQLRNVADTMAGRIQSGLRAAAARERQIPTWAEVRAVTSMFTGSFAIMPEPEMAVAAAAPTPDDSTSSRCDSSWSAFQRSHPTIATEAERWLDQLLDAGPPRPQPPPPSRAAPDDRGANATARHTFETSPTIPVASLEQPASPKAAFESERQTPAPPTATGRATDLERAARDALTRLLALRRAPRVASGTPSPKRAPSRGALREPTPLGQPDDLVDGASSVIDPLLAGAPPVRDEVTTQ